MNQNKNFSNKTILIAADAYIQKPIVAHQQFANTIQELLSKQNKKKCLTFSIPF